MIATALEVEVEEYVGSFTEEADEDGSVWWSATAGAASGG